MPVRTVIASWWYRCSQCAVLNSDKTAKCACGGTIRAAGQEVVDSGGERALWAVITLGFSEVARAVSAKDDVMYFTTCAACGQQHQKVPCHACGADHHMPVFNIGDPPKS